MWRGLRSRAEDHGSSAPCGHSPDLGESRSHSWRLTGRHVPGKARPSSGGSSFSETKFITINNLDTLRHINMGDAE